MPHELLSPEEVRLRWPQFEVPDGVETVYTADSGIAHAARTVATLQMRARVHGADIRDRTPVERLTPDDDGVIVHTARGEQADAAAPSRPPRTDPDAAAEADWIDTGSWDARALFRFSALTFNTHLIHYDRSWAREVEGLPDLLVHGPLTRILLMDAARRHAPGRTPATLSMKATAPVLVDREVRFAGREEGDATRITALGDDDAVLATARIVWA